MNRTSSRSPMRALGGSKVILGTAIVVVTLVVVYISYTAQNGLPLVPTYDIQVDVPDAAGLTKNADVRVGGARVGQVLKIQGLNPTRKRGPAARLSLALDKSLEPLSADTGVQVRLASVLGGRYVALAPGHSRRHVPANGVLPYTNSRPSTTLDDGLQAFAAPVPQDLRRTIDELGNAFAGRGGAFNDTIAETRQLFDPLTRVLRVLNDPRTNLAGFVRSVAGAMTSLEPVSEQLGVLLERGARTLRAIDAASPALGQTLDALPGTETVSTSTLRNVGPVLRQAARISVELRPAASLLPLGARRLDAVLNTATPVLRRIPALSHTLEGTLVAVDRNARDPSVRGVFEALGPNDLVTAGASIFVGLGGILRGAAQAQLNCNAPTLWARNLGSLASEGNAAGSWVRFLPVFALNQTFQSAGPSADLHANIYPHENTAECESGNEPFAPGQALGNPPGRQSRHVEITTPPDNALELGRRAGLVPGGG